MCNIKYCSKQCAGQSLSTQPHPCEQCGIPTTNKRFCSQKCYGLANRVLPQEPCEICGKPTVNEKYCSQECMGRAYRTIEEHPCEQCSEMTRNRRFCTHECYGLWLSIHHVGPDHPTWAGGWEPYYGENWQEQRAKAIMRDGSRCRICGHFVTGSDCHVHHYIALKAFSGDWRTANKLSNLVTLCSTHHSKVTNGVIKCPHPDSPHRYLPLQQLPLDLAPENPRENNQRCQPASALPHPG